MRRFVCFAIFFIIVGGVYSQEKSAGGTLIIRNEELKPDLGNVATLSGNEMDLIQNHIDMYVGKVDKVFHELVSEKVHIDICLVNPTEDKNYYTLVTMGMSTLPMNNPNKEHGYMELYLCLPANWKLDEKSLNEEDNYWPIRLLKTLAKFPYEYDDYLFYGHSMPNGDPAEPYASNTKLSNVIIYEPQLIDSEFAILKEADKTIYFLPILPLYENEMQFKLNTNLDRLGKLLTKYKVNELLIINRINVISRKK